MNIEDMLSNMSKIKNLQDISKNEEFRDYLNDLNYNNDMLIKLIEKDNEDIFKDFIMECKKNNNNKLNYNSIKIYEDNIEYPLLIYTVMKKLNNITLSIINSGLFDINIKDPLGNTPLIYSIQNNNNDITTILLDDVRTDVNCIENVTGMNCLMLSILLKNMTISKKLIHNKDIDITYCDNDKENVLFKCLFMDNYELFNNILNLNIININHQQIDGDTLLHEIFIYKKNRYNNFFDRLIKEPKLNVNIKNNNNLTAYEIEAFINENKK